MKKKYYYLLSIFIFIAGLIAFGNYVYYEYLSLNDLLVKFNVPGQTEINIDTPGMYDIYFEGGLNDKGGIPDENSTNGLIPLSVKNAEGVNMPLQVAPESKKYSFRGRRGVSVYEVNLPRAGSYEFTGLKGPKSNNKQLTLFLDKGFSDKRSHTIVTAQAILLIPIVASLVLFLYAYSKSRF